MLDNALIYLEKRKTNWMNLRSGRRTLHILTPAQSLERNSIFGHAGLAAVLRFFFCGSSNTQPIPDQVGSAGLWNFNANTTSSDSLIKFMPQQQVLLIKVGHPSRARPLGARADQSCVCCDYHGCALASNKLIFRPSCSLIQVLSSYISTHTDTTHRRASPSGTLKFPSSR